MGRGMTFFLSYKLLWIFSYTTLSKCCYQTEVSHTARARTRKHTHKHTRTHQNAHIYARSLMTSALKADGSFSCALHTQPGSETLTWPDSTSGGFCAPPRSPAPPASGPVSDKEKVRKRKRKKIVAKTWPSFPRSRSSQVLWGGSKQQLS